MTRSDADRTTAPWWRHAMVWMVLSGPAAAIVAGVVTLVIAVQGSDPEVERVPDAQARVATKDPLAPALRARNHAATPARP